MEELLKLEKDWIKKGFGNSLYIRPFVIATEECVSANPATKYKFMIICSPAQAYYSGEVRVQFSEKYRLTMSNLIGSYMSGGKIPTESEFQQIDNLVRKVLDAKANSVDEILSDDPPF